MPTYTYIKEFYDKEVLRITYESDQDIETKALDVWVESMTITNKEGETVEIQSFLEILPDSLSRSIYEYLYSIYNKETNQ